MQKKNIFFTLISVYPYHWNIKPKIELNFQTELKALNTRATKVRQEVHEKLYVSQSCSGRWNFMKIREKKRWNFMNVASSYHLPSNLKVNAIFYRTMYFLSRDYNFYDSAQSSKFLKYLKIRFRFGFSKYQHNCLNAAISLLGALPTETTSTIPEGARVFWVSVRLFFFW